MDIIESDATYCSEVEKEQKNLSQLRRSRRLSQKFDQSFRSDEDPVSQRFEEIYQLIESDEGCKEYSKNDWFALKTEVNLLRNALKSVARSKLTFVIKKIQQKLRNLKIETNLQDFSNVTNEGANSSGAEKSPNILAGMTTELLTEIPPYQGEQSSRIAEMTNKKSSSSEIRQFTQANPLDLTKKPIEKPEERVEPVLKDISNNKPASADLLHCPTIDLTEFSQSRNNIPHRNESKEKSETTCAVGYTSKWLKYLPTQQRPQEICEKENISSSPKNNPKPFRRSLIRLYKDIAIPANTTAHKSKTSNSRCSPARLKSSKKTRHKHNLKRQLNPQFLRNTESVFRRDCDFDNVQLRTVQTEHFGDFTQDSPSDVFPQDVFTFSDDKSSVSLPFSLKKSFKKVFGTDSLNDVLGCEKIMYSLTDRHVEQLAKVLSVKKNSLKEMIEKILLDDNCVPVTDGGHSEDSVLECSQSPTPRLYPSQRSQKQI